MAFSEDLDVFINDDTPGFKTMTVDGSDVDGIFSKNFEEVNFVGSNNPVFITKTSNIPSVANGSVVADDSNEWEVIGIEPDGDGVTTLELRYKWPT